MLPIIFTAALPDYIRLEQGVSRLIKCEYNRTTIWEYITENTNLI